MFKKMLVIMMVLGFVFAGSSMACQGEACVDDKIKGYADDYDVSHKAYGNDNAYAIALGGGGFEVFAETCGKHFSQAGVWGTAVGNNDADTIVSDWGESSHSFAEAKVDGWSYAGGETLAGYYNVSSLIEGKVYFEGNVYQYNNAREEGYSNGQFAIAGNQSGFNFYKKDKFFDNTTSLGANFEDEYISGQAKTKGESYVNIDPTGDNRSMRAWTKNCSLFDGNAYMSGDGFAQGFINNSYGSFASGLATFDYSGHTNGALGNAEVNGSIQKTYGSTVVNVNASSYATTQNGCVNCGNITQ